VDSRYRIENLKKAWRILKEEFSKLESERNENKVNHASYLIHTFAKTSELPEDEFCPYDDYFDFVPFDIKFFHADAILEYADRMLSQIQKTEDTRKFENVIEWKQKHDKEANDIYVPVIEEMKIKVKKFIEFRDCLSTSEVIENITKVMAGQGDMKKLEKMLNLIFEVDGPEDPRHGDFFNNAFAKRVWSSLNMLQKKWLIKNGFLSERAIAKLRESF